MVVHGQTVSYQEWNCEETGRFRFKILEPDPAVPNDKFFYIYFNNNSNMCSIVLELIWTKDLRVKVEDS